MADSYNIPKMTAGLVTRQLTDIYSMAYENDMLSSVPSVMLWGAMGVGKSSAVRAVAKELTKKIGKEIGVTDIRLLNYTPSDLVGIPCADKDKNYMIYLKPKIFDLPTDIPSILFLDEISAAPQSLQAAAYQIALDKRIGQFELPKNCIVICAGNRTTDKSVAFRMPKALANRLMHFEVVPDFDSWIEWAVENEIDARVTGYLAFNNSRLSTEPNLEELAFATPRSWEFVSRILKLTGKTPQEVHNMIAGCIGIADAMEFEKWCRIWRKLPKTADILSGKYTDQVKETDVIYALISSLLACISQRRDTISGRELENACRYAAGFPADFSAMFFRGLLAIDSMNTKLAKVDSFLAWMRKNRRFL